VFKLDNEDMGVDIKYVDQIIPYKQTVKVPNTPDFIEGLLSLRGKVYTVFNTRKRFHLPAVEYDENTKIIIVNTNSIKVGLIVDEVSEILRTEDENFERSTDSFANLDKKFISGTARINESLIVLLDLNEIITFSSEDLSENDLGGAVINEP
jgi:purine-binding chemotaxis protein CheW